MIVGLRVGAMVGLTVQGQDAIHSVPDLEPTMRTPSATRDADDPQVPIFREGQPDTGVRPVREVEQLIVNEIIMVADTRGPSQEVTSSAGVGAPGQTAETEICLAQRRRVERWSPCARQDELNNELNKGCPHGEGEEESGQGGGRLTDRA